MTSKKIWTEREIAVLKAMLSDGHSFAEIGERLGRAPDCIKAKTKHLLRVVEKPIQKRKEKPESTITKPIGPLVSAKKIAEQYTRPETGSTKLMPHHVSKLHSLLDAAAKPCN